MNELTRTETRTKASEFVRSNFGWQRRVRQNIPLLLMFLPVIAFYIIVKFVPMFGLMIAFKNYNFIDGVMGSPWAGFKYFRMMFENPQTLQIVRNTVMLGVLSLVFGFPFPILVAVMLNEARRAWFKRIVQTIIYLPHFFSWVIVGGIVLTVFAQQGGVVNLLLERWFGESYPFLYKPVSWVAIFVGSGIWKEAGFSTIIYLAAMSNIDPSLYEASSLDGAGKLRQITSITIPGIANTVILLLILATGRIVTVGFDQAYMLQNSIVTNVSEVISTYVYRVGIQNSEFSLTAAVGLLESIVAFILVFSVNGIARRYGNSIW